MQGSLYDKSYETPLHAKEVTPLVYKNKRSSELRKVPIFEGRLRTVNTSGS